MAGRPRSTFNIRGAAAVVPDAAISKPPASVVVVVPTPPVAAAIKPVATIVPRPTPPAKSLADLGLSTATLPPHAEDKEVSEEEEASGAVMDVVAVAPAAKPAAAAVVVVATPTSPPAVAKPKKAIPKKPVAKLVPAAAAGKPKRPMPPNFKPPATRVTPTATHEVLKTQVFFRDESQQQLIDNSVRAAAKLQLSSVIFDNLPLQVALEGPIAITRLVCRDLKKQKKQAGSDDAAADEEEEAPEPEANGDAAAAVSDSDDDPQKILNARLKLVKEALKNEHEDIKTAITDFIKKPALPSNGKALMSVLIGSLRPMTISKISKHLIRDGVLATTQQFFARLGGLNHICVSGTTDPKTGYMHKDRHVNSVADFRVACAQSIDHIEPHQFNMLERREHDAMRELDRYAGFAGRLKDITPDERADIKQAFLDANDAILNGLLRIDAEILPIPQLKEFTRALPESVLSSRLFKLWISERISMRNVVELEATRAQVIKKQFAIDCAKAKAPEPPLKRHRGIVKPAPIYLAPVDISSDASSDADEAAAAEPMDA